MDPAHAGILLTLVLASCASGQFYGQNAMQQQNQNTAPRPEPEQNGQQANVQQANAMQATSGPVGAQQTMATAEASAVTEQQALHAMAQASNAFARELYQVLRSEPGNLLVSPLSAAAVLALAWTGAGGRTAQQLQKTLHLPPDAQQVTQGYKALFGALQAQRSEENLHLDVANRVFVQRGLGLRDAFARTAAEAFQAGAEELDFSRPAEAAASVNGWVRDRTRGKIERLVQPEALSSASGLLLANAVYFKGTWRTQFDPRRTVAKPFRSPAGARNVSLMSTIGDFPYARLHDLSAQALLLPYVGERVSMLVLLPDAVDGLAQLEAALAHMDVAQLRAQMEQDEVYVWLPRFSIRTSLALNDALVQLGLSDLFGSMADFSGVATQGVFLSNLLQKAVIEVNEEGSEAAAASGGIFLLSAGLYNFFRADHPFVFFLIDNETGTVIFQGRFVEPE